MGKRVSYKFSTQTIEFLKKLSEKRGISMTKVIERLVLKEAVKEGLED